MDPRFISDGLMAAAALGYVSASVCFFVELVKSEASTNIVRAARRLLALGVVLHAGFIAYHSFANHVCPVRTMHLGISTGALVAAGVYVVLRKTMRITGLGIFVAPVALVFLLAGRFITAEEVSPRLQSGMLPLHIASNVVGTSLFLLASGAAGMYLVQEWQLKTKRVMRLFGRVPSLSALDTASHRFLILAFPFITIGAVTGTLWVSELPRGVSAGFIRVALSYLFWLVVASVVLVRVTARWQGRRAALGTLVGFVLAVTLLVLYLSGTGRGTS